MGPLSFNFDPGSHRCDPAEPWGSAEQWVTGQSLNFRLQHDRRTRKADSLVKQDLLMKVIELNHRNIGGKEPGGAATLGQPGPPLAPEPPQLVEPHGSGISLENLHQASLGGTITQWEPGPDVP